MTNTLQGFTFIDLMASCLKKLHISRTVNWICFRFTLSVQDLKVSPHALWDYNMHFHFFFHVLLWQSCRDLLINMKVIIKQQNQKQATACESFLKKLLSFLQRENWSWSWKHQSNRKNAKSQKCKFWALTQNKPTVGNYNRFLRPLS